MSTRLSPWIQIKPCLEYVMVELDCRLRAVTHSDALELLSEIEVTERVDRPSLQGIVGRHPLMGKVLVVLSVTGDALACSLT